MSLRILRVIRITSFVLIFLLAGYYASTLVWETQPVATPKPTSGIGAARILPDFTLGDLRGDTRSIAEWAGRPLIINFWATWCAPCRREMPLLQTLHQERLDHSDGLAVIGIAIDRLDAAAAYIAESGITYPILAGQQDAMLVAEQFGPEFLALPFTVFTAPDGGILLLHSGELHAPELRNILKVSDRVAAGQLSLAEARNQLKP